MPPEHRAWMEAAVTMLREQRRGDEPLAEPVEVEIMAYWPLPKTRPAWCPKDRWANRRETSGVSYATKPDIDNVGKIVIDALVEAGILVDDRLVVDLNMSKRAVEGVGRVDIWVTPV